MTLSPRCARLGAALVTAGLVACGDASAPGRTATRGLKSHQARSPGPPAASTVRSAIRCAECHETYYQDWQGSAHATAATSPYYQRLLEGSEAATCTPCHTPLQGMSAGDPARASEGITCDACHLITAITPPTTPGSAPVITYDRLSNRRYSTLCDGEPNYFHRQGCAPLFGESALCGACHHLEWPVAEGPPLPVITDFIDWQASASSGRTSCQDCHMSKESGEVARGWRPSDRVSRHDLLGPDDDLLGATIAVETHLDADGLTISLTNEGAPHGIPAGLAGRRLRLTIALRDPQGATLAEEVRIYARILVDRRGDEVPFTAAHTIAADRRLLPGQPRREHLALPPGSSAANLRLELLDLSPEVADRLGLAPPEPRLLLERELPITAGDRR